MSRRVYLHIGAPKTGTTYLQDRLTLNAGTLRAHDVHAAHVVAAGQPALFHFRAALDVLGQDWGGPPGHAAGAWDTMVKRVRRLDGTVLVSHEIFAPARPERIQRVLHDLRDSEVHVVYSARDLGRQLPAAWQESIKQGRKWAFRRFLNRVERGSTWFFHAFDLPRVLEKWSVGVPAERIHVVTVPQREALRADRDLLWRRMCEAFGIDPAWASAGQPARQPLARRRRDRGDPPAQPADGPGGAARGAVRRADPGDAGPGEPRQPRQHPGPAAPAPLRLGRGAGAGLGRLARRSGVQVVGDVEDLRPVRPEPDADWQHPGRVRNKLKLNAAVDALAAMTLEAARRPDPDRTTTGPAARRASTERWSRR